MDIRDVYDADHLAAYDIDADHGCLPDTPPQFAVDRYPAAIQQYCEQVEQVADTLPDHVADETLRSTLDALETPPSDIYGTLDDAGIERLHHLHAFLGSAYVHQDEQDSDHLPAGVAVPLYATAERLDRQPILTYEGYVLDNVVTPSDSPAVEDITVRQTFTGAADEEWFIRVHAAIEAAAAPLFQAIPYAQRAAAEDDRETMRVALDRMDTALDDVGSVLQRMPERNSPDVFRDGYRPYMDGFEDVVYDGVVAFDSEPQSFRGSSGAQTTIFPAIDAAFGIDHDDTALTRHLADMEDHMPPGHRRFLSDAADGPAITDYVEQADDDLQTLHDSCVKRLVAFRIAHWQQVKAYLGNTGDTAGTGGTDYSAFLPQRIDNTEEQLIGDPADTQLTYLRHAFDGFPASD